MLENKRNVKKIRKILIVLITIIITTNIFIQIKNLAKENTEKILKTEITTIGTDEIKHMKAINLDKGTINPIYKPEWTKISSSLDETNKTLSIIVKGNASKTQTNNGVNINYNSNVTTTLQAEDIEVYIDGELDGDTNQNGKIDEGETSQIAKTVSTASPSATSAEITHTITLSGFEETIRKNGKNFKEWSGNISIKIGGRGQSTTTYTQDVLTDEYGNQNMMETDQNGTNADGSWINVTIQDGNIVANTEGKMFTDFIIPEYTYEYANTTIDHETKKVTIVFDVTDKYFANAQLTAEDITIAMIGDETSNVNTKTTKSLNLKTIETEITNATTGITYKTDGSIYYNGQKVGQRYELVIEGLEQLDENGLPNGYTYSGPMSIALPAGETNADGTLKKGIIDNSGNLNIGKTITIGIDETDGNMNTNESGTQQIVDVVDPIWSVGTSTTNATEKSATLTITGKDKYFKQSTLTEDKIKIYVNGVQTTAITKSLTTPTDIKETVDGVAEVVVGKEYTLTLSNLEPSTGGTGETENYTEFTPKNPIVGGTAKFRNENGGNIEIEIEAGTIEDQNQNFSNTQTFNLGYVDATVPEVYEVQKTKNTTEKTETIIFNVTDKNYDATDLVTKEEITVLVDGEQVDSINKSSLTSVEIITTIDGEEKIVGHQYTLVLSDFENATKNANGYKDYSGTVSIKIAENASKDTKGNTLNPATTTISDFVDFIKPVIEKVTVTNPIDTTNKTYTFKFTAIDKYMNIADLITPEEIKIYLDGVEATTITKTLTNTQINKTFKKTVDGAVIEGTHTIGHEYTLTLSGFEETQEQLATSGRNYLEWSGNLSIEILAGAVKDKGPNGDDNTPNQNELTPITGEFVDFIKPVIEKVSSTKNETAKTETIIFNVMDKYLETTDLLEDSEITVYVDGEEATTLTKQLTKLQDFTATVNGNTTHVVGQQYQLILSNFEQTRSAINRNREYSDWSGTISIDVEQGAVKDKGVKGDGNNPNINNQTTITGDFVDYIAPNITYEYVTGNIDYTGKTFTMVFDITDKYFTNSTLATEYANATTDEQKLAVLQNYLTIQIDGEDITNNNKITKKIIAIEDVKSGTTSYPLHKTIDGTVKTLDGTDSTLETHRTIGKRFTLEISDLEQEIVEVGDEYLDYSGIITVAIKNGIAKDTTENENIATTLTSGVNIPGGSGTGTVVDVVDPLWEVAGTATAKPVDQIASIPIKGTDKYLNTIGLTASDITVEVNGEVKTSTDGVTVSVQEDTTTILTYGKQYRVTVNGYAKDAYQVKITLREGLITDQSGNTSKQTSFILFSSLKETSTETSATSPFIGNTNIQRQKIEKIIFKDNLDGINSTRWDVSQLQDGSIWGWYTTDATTGNYTVYIGSYIIINGNVNSSYLFSHIGYNSNCKITGNTGATDGTQEQLIENLELLHVDSVTNMSNMFSYFGYSTMKTLVLGNAFDTGATTNMSNMFANCGYTEMTSLNLGEQFITTNVTNMSNMFENCGHEKMTSLDLGDNFNTTNATNMSNMFNGCGYGELTSLDFGDNFNTTNVTNMSNMFANFGFTKLTSLDLGDNFYTSNVTNMEKMFYNCGNTAMLALDLGPNFTQIPSTNTDFATGFGTSGAVIYVPESIYKNRTSFKLNSGDTSTGAGTIAVSSGRIINPIYKPEWTKVSSTLDTTTDPDNPTLSVNIKANANKVQTINGVNINYNSQVTSALTQNNIFVYIDGELDGDTNQNGIIDDGETPSITKTVTTASPSVTSDEITHVITLSNFVETLRQSGKNFTEWSGNIAIKIGGRGEQTSTYTANVLKDEYGNQNMMEIEETEGWINVSLKDEDTDHNTDGIMFEDFIKPEFTYEYSNTVIDHNAKTVTVVFDVTDKYFNNTTLATDTTANNIDVTFDGETPTNATKTLTKLQDLSRTVNGTEQKIGERYSFVISNLDQGGGSDYSGVMTLAFPANIITDKSGNTNIAKTITIGIDDPSTDDGDDTPVIVDVVDPIWKVENINIDSTNKKVTADLIATDKYLTGVENSTLTINDITVTVDGDENANTAITKELTEPTFSTNETTGLKEIKYVLTLSNFEEATRQAGKSFLEYSGTVKITIAEGTITDAPSDGQSNTNKEQEFELGHVDFIKPEIEKISSTKDETTKTETIIFNIMDKYLETTDVLTTDEIKVYVDGEEATTLTKQLTKLQDFTATVNGDTTHIVGQQYKLVLSDFEKARNAKNYKDWSGTISIEIVENAVKDKGVKGDGNDPNTNNAKTIQGDFTDFINPDIKYVHQSTDINKSGKTYTMTFTVTDKYYTSGKLGIDDLTINMKNGKLDSDGNEIIYNLKNEPVTISLQDTDLKATNVPITNTSGNIETVSELLIGHTYILTISNLEQLEVKQGFTTADYSGVITVAFDGNKILDRTIDGKQNGNIATTITTGINIPGGTTPDDAQVVDVVDPIWEKISSSAYAFAPTDKTTSIATLTFKGTDSYFANSTLTSENIKIFVNGTEVTTGITKTLSTATPLQEQRKEFGTDTTINKQYGVQYTLTIKGWAQDAHQIKVQLPTGTITDESGNTNKVTELLVYNALKQIATEGSTTSAFLGNSTIQRQNIENITFVSNIPETVYNVTTGEYVDNTAWDVSARQDKTIIAWYETQTSGALKVYIGSNDEIFANQNSSYLFNCIGYADICTATETITNINLLNVYSVTDMSKMFNGCGYKSMTSLDLGDKFDTSNVTNMQSMFDYCGYESMTSLDLGDKFDTSNVTNMQGMFGDCGYESMTSLDLGEKFDTSKVTDMTWMFSNCGYESMTSLDLGEKFDTSNVTNMQGMFGYCGYESMTSLDLGEKFDTSKVTDMAWMFRGCGYTAMTSLDLGDKFDTSKVTSMNEMFFYCGYIAMTSLDLGDLFYTTSVTSMEGMFGNCGHEEMTSLDLGPAFTKIADDADEDRFIKGCGKLGAIIYAPESIYKDITHLKLDTNSTTTIEYLDGNAEVLPVSLDPEEETTNTRGTINPIYKPQWTKQTTTIDETNKTLNVTIKGNASLEPQTINGVNINYNSKVTSTLTGDSINIYIDGELDGDTNKNGILDEGETTSITRSVVKDETNSTDTEIYYTITLSNIEEALRQSGKNFKEWSGNISIQPLKGTLKDAYGSHSTTDENGNTVVVKGEPGNGNMQEIDLTQGVWTKIELNDTTTDHNTEGTMFTDYIKPEFTYEYSNVETDTDANTIIDYENKKVTVVFDVTDKYFEQANITAENVTITVGGTEPDWTKATKTLTKKTLAEDKVVGGITYKANGDIYYTINGTSTKIGERYELVVTNLETENGIGYSGVMTMSFPAGIITDKSNNTNLAKTITIGIDDPENHEEHQNAKIVDVVNPLWTGPHNVNTINRTNNTVDVKILGSDKYYQTDIFAQALENGTINTALNKIKIYVDNVEQTSITKTLTKITDNTELQTLAQNADLQSANIEDVKVGYTLTLSNFGDLSGTTKIVIEQGTITDTSGNENIETTIPVGNINWEEANEPLEESDENYPRYSAFRNDIVDFIKPVIKYQYSAIEGSKNPNIDYETKTLTVKFTVTDKYLVQSSIMNADGTLNTENVRLQISTLNSSGESEFTDITNSGITTTITSTPITDGYEYTLVVQNFELIYNNTGEYMDYSGIVQLVFAQGQIDDTSGNKNLATTITIDTDDGNDPDSGVIVDVIDPIIEKTAENLSIVNTNNNIIRDIQNETGTVTIRIKATDKYLSTGTLQSAENVESIRVKIVKPDGNTIYPETITKTVTQISKQSTSIIYDITLGNFETNQGITSIIIPEGVITDTSGNVNQETEILVGNSTWTETGDTVGEYTAFKNSIVDFIRPTWEYSTSSITRNRDGETGTVTIKILGRDNYYLKDILTENKISVYVANSETPNTPITTITKALTKITDTEDLNGANTGYYLTLGNFQNYDGQVKIEIADNTIIDTSGNGNPLTQLNVGNSEWVETDIGDSETTPKYTAFRNSIVDFIKPIIRYQYTENANPLIDQENKQVAITFDAIDTNILESVITLNDIQILVDDINVTNVLTKTLTSTDIPEGSGNGLRYTLTLSNFELENILDGETFKRHSGKIELIIAENTVRDTSGNQNRETNIIIDNDNGDDENNYIIVDFIKPKIYYIDKFISWDKRYAEITIAGTDRFYDFTTTLSSDDITLYQQNLDGNYVQVTNLPITVTTVSTTYGYNFVVRLDDFEEEYKMKISIPAGVISDTQGHYNEATDIFVDLDNKKPIWKYISTNTSDFESNGNISFNVKGHDKFLDLENSGLEDGDVTIYKDGTDITNTIGVTITSQGQSDTEKSKTYKIDVTGLTEIGTYSLVIKDKTLIDEFDNESNTTTITFSKSAIATNTDNYQTVTYHASPDFEQTHQAYVHELMSVNTTGTNFENTTFRPSTIGEIYDDGKNTLFAEPFEYTAGEDGEDGVQTAYSFKGWGLANEKGFIEDEATATIYGLYDEIPNSVKATDGIVHLKAVWQQATVIFVSNGDGNNANDGLSPTTPVKDLQTAYSKISSSGTALTNIIVIMDQIEWNSSNVLNGNATITSLYAGIDYKEQSAELKISSNIEVNGDIIFDNIKLYSNSTTVSDGTDYLANGSYTNMLITNYGDITLGRRILTPEGKYTFGAVVGGNYKTESTTGQIGVHKVIVEAGKYNNIVIGSALTSGGQTTQTKYVSHNILIGNMKDATVSRNDKLTITGYLSMGELEDKYYAYNTSGSQSTTGAYSRNYANTVIYSGTFTGENKFTKSSENASIYLRAINGFSEGKVQLDMYGADITGNLYAGSRMATTNSDQEVNILNFYGGKLTGNMFGNGANDTSTGCSKIIFEGRFNITGNVFGGSNAITIAQGKVTGNTSILVNSSSVVIDGNIYGGSNGIIEDLTINTNNGLITGDTNIVLSSGTVNGDIYGSGYNCGNTGSTNITINNGTVLGSIYGGAYQNQVRTDANINILGGTVNAIYGGNVLTTSAQQNSDNTKQNANITINTTTGTINGLIYGSGKYDKIGTAEIYLISCGNLPTVYGGSDGEGLTDIVNIYLQGMTVNTIYGGSNGNGTVTTSNINLKSGTVTDVYGGGYGGTTTTSNVNLGVTETVEGTETIVGNAVITSIYGGSNINGTVITSNVNLKSGTVTNVFGGGNSAEVGTANVTLDGITVNTIHGGSKNAGNTTNTNVVLKSGTVTNVFGGGYDVGATNTEVTQKGATVTNIYGGNQGGTGDGGETINTKINIDSSVANNIYGGNMNNGNIINSVINIRGNSTINGKLYGGGYKSEVGKSSSNGSTTINISGGTINKDIFGGSEDSLVYGNTNINIGKNVVTDISPVAGNININGIYGGGTSGTSTNYSYISVYGNTHITMDNSTESPISFSGTIYGSGKGTNYSTNNTTSDESTIKISNFGSSTNAYQMVSIQRTGKLYIGNSYLELSGIKDTNNYYKNTSYTLNRITKGLALHDNSTLYTRKGFNIVGGFESFKTNADGTTEKQTVEISDNTVTRNVDNRIYTLEGINLIFAKQEGSLSNRASEDIWGDVNGMAFFGMYRQNRLTGIKEYDIYAPNYSGGAVDGFFANGSYIEGRHKANHDITLDGFYTNIADYSDLDNIVVTPQVIDVTDYGTYYDWIIGEDIVNYQTTLIASTYSTWSMEELLLDYKYQQGATYTVNRVSTNALDTNINLINQLQVPTYSANANNTFGLTMGTTETGWLDAGVTNIYTNGNGSFDGDINYGSDNCATPGKLIFKLYNSLNVTEDKDLGNINIVLTGKTRTGEDGSEGNTFKIVISVNIQSVYEEDKQQYTPRFTNSINTELNYTTDSSVDITYVLYKKGLTETIYTTGDYRVLSSTVQLPAGTKITMRDYGQGDNVNKVYYYQIQTNTDYDSTETVDGKTRYLYKLSKFIDMGGSLDSGSGIVAKYVDNNSSYYHSSGVDENGYVLEKYDISIDLVDSGIDTNQLEQETYLQLRSESGVLKYDNGDKDLIYNLYNQNAVMTQSISNEGQAYSVFENLTIPFTFDATLLEQQTADGENILDTKYYDKSVGLAIEIVNEVGERVKAPDVQNLKLTNTDDTTKVYTAGDDGVIRVPLSDGLATIKNNYKLSLSQYSVDAGNYIVRSYVFASDDGLHYGHETTVKKEFTIRFINRLLGLAGVESANDSRIINKSTGVNLEGNNGLDITVKVGSPTNDTNIRVELYKRNPTYTVTEDEDGNTTETYNGIQYTKVDLKDYLQGTWETPEDQGLITPDGCTEYMVMPKENYTTVIDIKNVEFERAVKDSISTGEYKLVFKAYYDNTLIQTVRKTFIVTP